jgi:Mitochondrial carrier protein
MKIGPDGSKEYKGAIDVLVKVCKHEGVFALWKGFWPYYFRLGPHTVITFIFMEQMNTAYNKWSGAYKIIFYLKKINLINFYHFTQVLEARVFKSSQ